MADTPTTEARRLIEEAHRWLDVTHVEPRTLAEAQVVATLAVAEAILQTGPRDEAVTVDRLADALATVGLVDHWTETGNEDARDGMREMTFDYESLARATLRHLHPPAEDGGRLEPAYIAGLRDGRAQAAAQAEARVTAAFAEVHREFGRVISRLQTNRDVEIADAFSRQTVERLAYLLADTARYAALTPRAEPDDD